jgi:hypothetical protein
MLTRQFQDGEAQERSTGFHEAPVRGLDKWAQQSLQAPGQINALPVQAIFPALSLLKRC